ncbi:TetR/AcrR family transcriptional regulator, partial [Escherichia coli]|nr:TetR/AcrR family transcriptional regulator [Escherichia coli]
SLVLDGLRPRALAVGARGGRAART